MLEIDLAGDAMRAATGAMIAYTGDVSFRNTGMGGGDGLRSALKRRVTGESISAGAQAVDRAGLGTGKFLASSSGPVIFAEPPIRVDPQALVGWPTARHPRTTSTPAG